MTFGERLVFYRNQAGYSQKQLAEKLDIIPTRLNYWEKDKREPDVQMIKALAQALSVSSDDLLGIKEAPAPEEAEDDEISIEEMEKLLRALGFIGDGRELTEKDVKFLHGVFNLLDAWFTR